MVRILTPDEATTVIGRRSCPRCWPVCPTRSVRSPGSTPSSSPVVIQALDDMGLDEIAVKSLRDGPERPRVEEFADHLYISLFSAERLAATDRSRGGRAPPARGRACAAEPGELAGDSAPAERPAAVRGPAVDHLRRAHRQARLRDPGRPGEAAGVLPAARRQLHRLPDLRVAGGEPAAGPRAPGRPHRRAAGPGAHRDGADSHGGAVQPQARPGRPAQAGGSAARRHAAAGSVRRALRGARGRGVLPRRARRRGAGHRASGHLPRHPVVGSGPASHQRLQPARTG